MIVGTPVHAREVAAQLAEICDLSFVGMPGGDERDRFWAMASWVVDEFVADDDFHEGCLPFEVGEDWEAAAFEAGYEKAQGDALAAIKELGVGSTGERRQALREAYSASRGTESREAMDAMILAYRHERERSVS